MARKDSDLTATLTALQQALDALSARVARLEAQLVDIYADEDDDVVVGPGPGQADTKAQGPGPKADSEIDPDVVLVIAAAVAAYLGQRAHVKQIRLVGSQAWGRQGRVSVQASHRLYR
jgi:methylmalonyl-CoA carboxyltransferase large subunit